MTMRDAVMVSAGAVLGSVLLAALIHFSGITILG